MDHSTHTMHDMAAAAGGFDFLLVFVAGVLGSGHCFGMCGALVSGYFMNAQKTRSYWPYFAYHLSRIFVYTLIGLTAAALGFVLVSNGMFGKIQGLLQMAIGLIVVVLALGILGLIPWQGSMRLLPMPVLSKGYAVARKRGPVVGAMLAGSLNGLMPCPLTFAMAVQATTAKTIIDGGLLMLTFGAGTVPTMIIVSIAFGKLGARVRGTMLKAAAIIMIAMGLNTAYTGLSFYTEEDFKHRHFLHTLKDKIDEFIVFLTEIVDYLNQMVSYIQNM